MKLQDELLEILGEYFVVRNIREQNCMTFEQFVTIYQAGQWGERVV